MDPEETAILLNVTTQRLAKWRLDGSGPPYFKLGRSIRYQPKLALAWLRSKCRRSTSDTGFAT